MKQKHLETTEEGVIFMHEDLTKLVDAVSSI